MHQYLKIQKESKSKKEIISKTIKAALPYKLFNLSPKNNTKRIGIASKITKIVFVENNSGLRIKVKIKPPIAPPKWAACPIFPTCFFIP